MNNKVTQTISGSHDAALIESSNQTVTQTVSCSTGGFRKFSAACLTIWQNLKDRVTTDLASEFSGVLNSDAVRRVVSDAEALVVTTPYPALFLPVLAEEKVRSASQWQTRQHSVSERSLTLAA